MNIKTTILLLVLLAGVGAYVLFTRDKDSTETKPVVHTLVDVKSSDVTRFTITSSDGKVIAAQKTTDSNGLPAWKLTQPVNAAADTYKITTLLDSITSLKSTAELPSAGAIQTGLEKPRYTVDVYTGSTDNKLVVGDPLTVSDGVYVRVGDHQAVDVVPTSLTDALDKPANDLRKTQLFETSSPAVQQFTLTHRDGEQLVLQKQNSSWKMIKPTPMPVDSSAAEDLISAVVNMTPVEFIDDPSQARGLNKPIDTVEFTAAAPTTGPATQPATMPNGVKVLFGSYDDLQKKNIFAQTADGTIVKVSATVLDSLNKKPFELRDKTVLDVDPVQVSNLEITISQPATTQPTVTPASTKTTLLGRRKNQTKMGPVLPTTTTAPTTASTTAPTMAPSSQWYVAGPKPIDADDAKVTALLAQFHPLKADKYLEKSTVTRPVKVFTIMLSPANGFVTQLTLTDPGNDLPLVGTYNGLTFELPRGIATDLGADFAKSPAAK